MHTPKPTLAGQSSTVPPNSRRAEGAGAAVGAAVGADVAVGVDAALLARRSQSTAERTAAGAR